MCVYSDEFSESPFRGVFSCSVLQIGVLRPLGSVSCDQTPSNSSGAWTVHSNHLMSKARPITADAGVEPSLRVPTCGRVCLGYTQERSIPQARVGMLGLGSTPDPANQDLCV
jgi:hypothetical protein